MGALLSLLNPFDAEIETDSWRECKRELGRGYERLLVGKMATHSG